MLFRPTRYPIEVDGARREWVDVPSAKPIECFVREVPSTGNAPAALIVKYVGAEGRAENATPHPLEVWPETSGVIWSSNPRGYGQTSGQPRLQQHIPEMLAVFDAARSYYPDALPVLSGASLGAASALVVASQRTCEGLILRDVPSISDVILERFGSWTLGAAHYFAAQVPAEMDTIAAAANCNAPALFITSRRDRTVPPVCQDRVIQAYAGEKFVVRFERAGHSQPGEPAEMRRYLEGLSWLHARLPTPD